MTDSAIHHPDSALLGAFVSGDLPMGINLAISSHVDQCPQCREGIARVTQATSQQWFEVSTDNEQGFPAGLSDVLEHIVTQPARHPASEPRESRLRNVTGLRLWDREIKLPPLLTRILAGRLNWNEIGRGIHQVLLDVDPLTKCEIIHMGPGARVPDHTHLGSEFMLVLDGDITDSFGSYGPGDFVARDKRDRHWQTTDAGCLCLFVTDAPLLFTEGLARLINPLNRLRFWWSRRRTSKIKA